MMENACGGSGGCGRREGGGGSGGDSAFIQWLTTIHDEIDSTADTLKDEVNIVKVRRITPNLEILGNGARAGSGRARTNAVMGLDDAVAKAIKNLQILRINLKEESQQLFNFPVDRMEMEAIQKKLCSTQATHGGGASANVSNVFGATSPLVPGRGGTEIEHLLTLSRIGGVAHCEDDTFGGSGSKAGAASDVDNTMDNRGGNNGEVEMIPPSVPIPEPVAAGCSSNNARNNGPASTKYQKTNEIGFDDGSHERSPLSVISPREWSNEADATKSSLGSCSSSLLEPSRGGGGGETERLVLSGIGGSQCVDDENSGGSASNMGANDIGNTAEVRGGSSSTTVTRKRKRSAKKPKKAPTGQQRLRQITRSSSKSQNDQMAPGSTRDIRIEDMAAADDDDDQPVASSSTSATQLNAERVNIMGGAAAKNLGLIIPSGTSASVLPVRSGSGQPAAAAHPPLARHRCPKFMCSKEFCTPESLRAHVDSEHWFKCGACGLVFDVKTKLNRHQRYAHSDWRRNFL